MNAERIRSHYEPRIAPGRPSYEVLDWSSPAAQTARFDVLCGVLTRRRTRPGDGTLPPGECAGGPLVLDVGCGLADLRRHLRVNGVRARYLGVDISLAMLHEAHRRHPGAVLMQADLFKAAPLRSRSVDVVFCSGVFNFQLGNNLEFALCALPVLLGLARGCVVANFLHQRARFQHRECHYFDPATLVAPLRRLGARVELCDDYLENDFTVIAWPPDSP